MRSKFIGILLALSFFALLELVVRITDVYYFEQPEIFFVNLKKRYVESGKGNADIVIIGDSRSMALEGYSKKTEGEYSVYNHSLPAMGPKYYRFFLDKYIRKGNVKPKMILFAGSPKLYSSGYGPPLYDPSGKVVNTNESLADYLKRRWNEGWEKNIFQSPKKENIISYSGKQDDFDQILWEFFGHRYLHQFSISELWEQYEGVERIFIVTKAIPLLYESYRFHGAVRNALSATHWKVSPNYLEKSKLCEKCENVEAGLCVPPSSQKEDNLIIQDQIERHLGKYNISNRLKPELVLFAREKFKEDASKEIVNTDPSSWEKPDYQVLEDLITYARSKEIVFGFVYMPWIAEREKTPEVQYKLGELKKFFAKNQDVGVFFFPESGYPSQMFVDNIHYDCRGESRINGEFHEIVLPEVFRFLQKKEKSN
ncbi:DUF1574 family protein [Leptospira idonii]|uniref:DUF1574 domain-containing protein n=1 Tax=Leptospira idonii TaxID=1193500 RepID=A0A4R9M8M4_9LEPT|nr:DUF1574 family protein [Leptospira idonii]TGN20858.1 DUF1574 domain-containing protein [Leptospira idonii]